MGAAYFSITNHGKTPDTLMSASTPAAARVEFHQTSIAGGMARMRPLIEIVIEPGETLKIEPGAIHLMLVELKAPLTEGGSVPLTLQFRAAGALTVQLRIEARDAPPAAENTRSRAAGVVTVIAAPGIDNFGNRRPRI